LATASILRNDALLDPDRPPEWADGLFMVYFQGEDGVAMQVEGQPTDGIFHFPSTPWRAAARARTEARTYAQALSNLQSNGPGSFLWIKSKGELAGGGFGPNQIPLLKAVANGTATTDEWQAASRLRIGTDINTVHWGPGHGS
jgi:hypothetical protein